MAYTDKERKKLYGVYFQMKKRCYDPDHPKYPRYGQRGIKVCQRWLDSFQNFLDDMGPRPEGYSLDRENNDGDYCPENCRWATGKTQANNQREKQPGTGGNRIIELDGLRMTLSQWADYKGVPRKVMTNRLVKGMSEEEAINFPYIQANEKTELGTIAAVGGELHHSAKLSNLEVLEIHRLYATGDYSHRDLGKIFEVTGKHVGKILRGKCRIAYQKVS